MCFTFRVGEPLPNQVARPPCEEGQPAKWPEAGCCGQGLSSSSPASPLLCLRKAPKAFDAKPSPCPRPGGVWGPPALPCSPRGCELHFLRKGKLVRRYFSTAGQTTSSRNKLFLALGNSFLKKYDLPQTDEACYVRKIG